jgi:hypothetical protein
MPAHSKLIAAACFVVAAISSANAEPNNYLDYNNWKKGGHRAEPHPSTDSPAPDLKLDESIWQVQEITTTTPPPDLKLDESSGDVEEIFISEEDKKLLEKHKVQESIRKNQAAWALRDAREAKDARYKKQVAKCSLATDAAMFNFANNGCIVDSQEYSATIGRVKGECVSTEWFGDSDYLTGQNNIAFGADYLPASQVELVKAACSNLPTRAECKAATAKAVASLASGCTTQQKKAAYEICYSGCVRVVDFETVSPPYLGAGVHFGSGVHCGRDIQLTCTKLSKDGSFRKMSWGVLVKEKAAKAAAAKEAAEKAAADLTAAAEKAAADQATAVAHAVAAAKAKINDQLVKDQAAAAAEKAAADQLLWQANQKCHVELDKAKAKAGVQAAKLVKDQAAAAEKAVNDELLWIANQKCHDELKDAKNQVGLRVFCVPCVAGSVCCTLYAADIFFFFSLQISTLSIQQETKHGIIF